MEPIKKIVLACCVLLFHPQQGQAVDRQFAASVVTGWIDMDGGTLFYASPSALCPGGNLRYESDHEVTCSNASRVYGIYSFACPIGYLPDGHPRITWPSVIRGPYGVGPDGLVYLGVGPGGPVACARDATKLPRLIFSGPQQILPFGLTGYADAPFVASVLNGDDPVVGVPIIFSVAVLANSGNHEHHDNSRPPGKLNIFNGTTDAQGEIKLWFQAPDISGTHTITAACGMCTNPHARADIHVKVSDLVPISPNPPRNPDGSYVYALTSVDKTHAGYGRYHHHQYHLTGSSLQNLLSLLKAFSEEGWGTVALNDASLSWGGRYDIRADWKAPHAGHRNGREIDISFTRGQNPVSTRKQKAFYKKFCEERSAQVSFSILHHHVLNPHFHVYLEKQTNCWTTEN